MCHRAKHVRGLSQPKRGKNENKHSYTNVVFFIVTCGSIWIQVTSRACVICWLLCWLFWTMVSETFFKCKLCQYQLCRSAHKWLNERLVKMVCACVYPPQRSWPSAASLNWWRGWTRIFLTAAPWTLTLPTCVLSSRSVHVCAQMRACTFKQAEG